MDLPVMPPVKPMLAKPVKDMPTGDVLYEPKWDNCGSYAPPPLRRRPPPHEADTRWSVDLVAVSVPRGALTGR